MLNFTGVRICQVRDQPCNITLAGSGAFLRFRDEGEVK